MNKEIFKDFKLESKVSPELLAKYKDILPEEMLAVWREYGFGTILGGYLKLINPEDYVEVMKDSYYAADRAVPVMLYSLWRFDCMGTRRIISQVVYDDGQI